jgi:uncharacterized protein YjiS (DUF1127 family)
MAAQVITSKDINALTGRTYPATEPAAPLLAWFRRVRTRFARYRLYRETVAALAELDDRILADIGIGRHEIHEIARAMSRNAL